jgi:hypothetical protein
MPVASGKAVGSQNIAKAGVNLEEKPSDLPAGNTVISAQLVTAGMPKLTWLLTCGQTHSIQVQPEVAYRRAGVGTDAYEFIPVAPITLVASGSPFTLELNAPAQAMRLSITNPGAAPGSATQLRIVLMASG